MRSSRLIWIGLVTLAMALGLAAGGTTIIKTGEEGKCTVEDPVSAGANRS